MIKSKQNSLKVPIDNLLYAALSEASQVYQIDLDFDEFALDFMMTQCLHADLIYTYILTEMKSMAAMNTLEIKGKRKIIITQNYILSILKEKNKKVIEEQPAAPEELDRARQFLDITEQSIRTLQGTSSSNRQRIGIKEIALHLKDLNYFHSSASDTDSIRQLFYKERDKLKRAIRAQLRDMENRNQWPQSKKLKPFKNLLDN